MPITSTLEVTQSLRWCPAGFLRSASSCRQSSLQRPLRPPHGEADSSRLIGSHVWPTAPSSLCGSSPHSSGRDSTGWLACLAPAVFHPTGQHDSVGRKTQLSSSPSCSASGRLAPDRCRETVRSVLAFSPTVEQAHPPAFLLPRPSSQFCGPGTTPIQLRCADPRAPGIDCWWRSQTTAVLVSQCIGPRTNPATESRKRSEPADWFPKTLPGWHSRAAAICTRLQQTAGPAVPQLWPVRPWRVVVPQCVAAWDLQWSSRLTPASVPIFEHGRRPRPVCRSSPMPSRTWPRNCLSAVPAKTPRNHAESRAARAD